MNSYLKRGAMAAGLFAMLTVSGRADCADQARTTDWVLRAAPGIDAVLMIGVASGDVMQADLYAETIAFVKSRMSAEGLAALGRIDQAMRVRNKQLTGPSLAFLFSAGPTDSIDAVIASAVDPLHRLRPGLMALPDWDEDRFKAALELMPDVATALRALKAIGFEDWYAIENLPKIKAAIEAIGPTLSGHDIISEQARLLGRDLEPRIEFLVVRFSRPYGIKIIGQRFVAHYGLPAQTLLRIATHEIFHPPFALNDKELFRRLESLRADPWVQSIVENHDPAFGYNSFEGVMNEDSAQALDQIVSERLGFARDAGRRWQHADGGMHMIAAGLYHAMKEDGFAESGGVYGDWLKSALDRGLLTPQEVRRRAGLVVGEAAVQRWFDARTAAE